MSDRFFCAELSTNSVLLSDAESHHAIHVLRLSKGDRITLFDGRGTVAHGDVQTVTRTGVTVAVDDRQFVDRDQSVRVVIAAPPPKGDRLKWMIEKLTELGVAEYIPLRTQRSVVNAKKLRADKLRSTVISASKQCGRAWLMDIAAPKTLSDIVQDDCRLYLAHPYESEDATAFPDDDSPPAASHVVLIGPEGGFTDDEVRLARTCEAQQILWPGAILRIETAAIMAAVALCQPLK